MPKLSTYPDLDPAALDGTERIAGFRSTSPKNFGLPLGWIPISSQEVSSAVANVDIDLPTSGYDRLMLVIDGLAFDDDGYSPAFQLSVDGGSSFLTDAINADTYKTMHIGGPSPQTDATIYSNRSFKRVSGTAEFIQGAANTVFVLSAYFTGRDTGQPNLTLFTGSMNGGANTPPPSNGVNAVRLTTAETAGNKITAGKLNLFGIPTAA